MNCKLLFITLLGAILSVAGLSAQTDSLLVGGQAAYAKGDYAQAADFYKRAIAAHGESAEVYYNLGNAYYKANQIAPAILAYERALLIDPGDADIRFNLNMARQRTVDKIEPVGEFFLSRWLGDVQDMGAADSWAKLGLAAFLLMLACLAVFFFAKRRLPKQIGAYALLPLLVIVVMANVFAHDQKAKRLRHDAAIVFAPTVSVKSSPNESGTDLFVLHEGAKVAIKSSLGDWREIRLADGNVGWMPAKDMEII
jgi:tetratricopeptide (TPR) repeat protein